MIADRAHMSRVVILTLVLVSSWLCSRNPGSETSGRTDRENRVLQVYDSLEKKQVALDTVASNGAPEYILSISNQKQFEALQTSLLGVLESGNRNIRIIIKSGNYYFNDGHLTINKLNYPDADVCIEGEKVFIVPRGRVLKNGDTIGCEVSGESCYVDLKRKKTVLAWDELRYADSIVEIVDKDKKICRLKSSALKGILLPEGNMAYVELTRWCRCIQYKVLKIIDGWVYFIAHDLEIDPVFGSKQYNVNYDFILARVNPRFRLCNAGKEGAINIIGGKVKLASPLNSLLLGEASNFLTILNSHLRRFSIRGITFLGGTATNKALLDLRGFKTIGTDFSYCRFVGQMGRIATVFLSDNVRFHHNYIADNYEWGIVSEYNSVKTYIDHNVFDNNGCGLSYARCVSCFGEDYYVGHNTFKNFGYCAISVGLPYGSEMKYHPRGVVEFNHIYYDMQYYSEAWKHNIMDSGAIYVWTQNEECIIRYNYIHDYNGAQENRGIYCDDGAHHVALYGNIVINTPGCHAIGSRRVASTEKSRNKISWSERNNVNNTIMFNLTDGTINFVGNEQAPNYCVYGNNILLQNNRRLSKRHRYQPELKNLDIVLSDYSVKYRGYNANRIIVSKEAWKTISHIVCSDNVKRYVRVK